MQDSIQFGSKVIDFTLNYVERKSLGITVAADMSVNVKAPVGTSIIKVREKVKKKAPWILKQQNFFLSFEPRSVEKKYINGESHLYLGRQYKLIVTTGKINDVSYKGRCIDIIVTDKSKTKKLVKNWYKEKAREKFAEIAEPLIQRFKKYNVEPKGLYILEMENRWGSCTSKGKIILNPELLKAPKGCIEYVIIHELCHLVHHNHNKKFIDLQTKEMPDWIKWKNKLEKLLA